MSNDTQPKKITEPGLAHKFSKAQRQVNRLSTRPDDDTLLRLYSLYKQGNEGDVKGRIPIAKGLVSVAKWKAWKKCLGMSQEDAKMQYIELVNELLSSDSDSSIASPSEISNSDAKNGDGIIGLSNPDEIGMSKEMILKAEGRITSWEGLTVLVTGASRGIGKATALRFAEEGANLILCGRSMQEGQLPGSLLQTKEEVEALGGNAYCAKVDLRNAEEIADAVEKGAIHFGGIDALACNAGALFIAPFESTPIKRFDLVHDVNIRATFALCQAALPYLRRSNYGRILVLAPPIALHSKWLSGTLAYTLSKYSMSMLVLGLSEELEPDEIAVNAMWPATTIDTAAVRYNKALGGDEMVRRSRKARICADAAIEIMSRTVSHTGEFHTDESALREIGETDFEKYSVEPGATLQVDYYL
jgi:citronellol/citronellal dehydrogenase